MRSRKNRRGIGQRAAATRRFFLFCAEGFDGDGAGSSFITYFTYRQTPVQKRTTSRKGVASLDINISLIFSAPFSVEADIDAAGEENYRGRHRDHHGRNLLVLPAEEPIERDKDDDEDRRFP